MKKFLFGIAYRLWPELKSMSPSRAIVGVGEVIAFLYSAPLAIAGVIWLARNTDFRVIQKNILIFLLFFALIVLFFRLRFFLIIELRTNRYGSSDGTMAGLVL